MMIRMMMRMMMMMTILNIIHDNEIHANLALVQCVQEPCGHGRGNIVFLAELHQILHLVHNSKQLNGENGSFNNDAST